MLKLWNSARAVVLASLLAAGLAPTSPAAAADYYFPDRPLAVTGLFVVGQTLTAAVPEDPQLAVSYQWMADHQPLAGETGPTLLLTKSLAGAELGVELVLQTPSTQPSAYGIYPSAEVLDIPFTSDSSTLIDGVRVYEPYCKSPEATGTKTPTIGWNIHLPCQYFNTSLGMPSQVLTGWYRDGQWLEGETRSSYNLTAEDVGATLTGAMVAIWDNGAVYLNSTVLQQAVPERVDSAKPVITGEVDAGATLTATTSGFDPVALLTYQWFSDFLPIPGATSRTLVLSEAQAGSRLQVLVTATRDGYTTSSRVSDAVGEVDDSVAMAAYESIIDGYTATTKDYGIDFHSSPEFPAELLTQRKAEVQKAADFWADVLDPTGFEAMYFTRTEAAWAQAWFATNHANTSVNIQKTIDTMGCPFAIASRFDYYLFYQCADLSREANLLDEQITPHEYTHWVQYSRSSSLYLPATPWLVEGQANFYGLALEVADEDALLSSVNVGLAQQALPFDDYVGAPWSSLRMLQMLKSGDVTDVRTLLSRSGSARDSYVVGTLLSEWLVLKFGHEKYWQWVSGILDGKGATADNGAALTAALSQSVFGITWSEFADSAIPYLSMRARQLEERWLDEISPDLPPNPPVNLQAIAGDGQATLSWDTPNDNGSPILGYRVRWGELSEDCATSPCTVSGLNNGTEYEFRVVAYNKHGDSPESWPSNRVKPAGAPGEPTIIAARAGDRSVVVSWSTPASNGAAITGYRLDWQGGSKVCASSPCTANGLVNGRSYQFTVTAINDVGDSAPSAASASVTPAGAPRAPTKVMAKSSGVRKATITWSGAQGNGVAVVRYEVSWKLSTAKSFSAWKSAGAKTTLVLTGWLKDKKYQVRVRVITAKGSAISKTFVFKQTK